MHSIRTTPGLIIESRSYGEADKVLSIFTRDLGLVAATALGIRYEKSKLRYHAQDYSFGTFSFVRGKEYWRLTSAQADEAPVSAYGLGQGSEIMMRISGLLRRLLHGEEAHPELFECVESCTRFLDSSGSIGQEELKTFESIVVLRMLHALGYIGNDPMLAAYAGSSVITAELLKEGGSRRTLINQHINKALRESHL